jgi:hypothetical protein
MRTRGRKGYGTRKLKIDEMIFSKDKSKIDYQ